MKRMSYATHCVARETLGKESSFAKEIEKSSGQMVSGYLHIFLNLT